MTAAEAKNYVDDLAPGPQKEFYIFLIDSLAAAGEAESTLQAVEAEVGVK